MGLVPENIGPASAQSADLKKLSGLLPLLGRGDPDL